MSGILAVGDEPMKVHGTYHIHCVAPIGGAGCMVEVSHFVDDEDSWYVLVEVLGSSDEYTAQTVATLGGYIRITGDPAAKLSVIGVSR